MPGNTFGQIFTVTTFGESHGKAIGCIIDGCPPNIELSELDIQPDLDKRKPGTSRHVTQRREADEVEILSGVFEGKTTGTPIALLIRNTDQRSKDYGNIAESFRPGHADYTYWHKYGIRDYRGGGRSSARETAARVAAVQSPKNGCVNNLAPKSSAMLPKWVKNTSLLKAKNTSTTTHFSPPTTAKSTNSKRIWTASASL